MYKVLSDFADAQDGYFTYKAGDKFPRPGMTVNAERVKELSTDANRTGSPLIGVEAEPKPVARKPRAKTKTQEG